MVKSGSNETDAGKGSLETTNVEPDVRPLHRAPERVGR